MLSHHGFHTTARALSRGSSRAFTTAPALCLPRKRPDDDGNSTSKSKKKPITKAEPAHVKKPLLGLLEQQARLDKSLKRVTAYVKGKTNTTAKAIIHDSKEHHDLQSFVAFADQKKLDPDTTVYKGTHYEYTVMETLKAFGMQLERVGKSNDKGIDLLGHWNFPGKPHQMKVIVQCKASRGLPSAVRELEGAFAGAPSEWQGDNVLALLACSKRLTPGVLEGVQKSRSALGALHIETDGLPRQFIWNHIAGERGLSGLGITSKYSEAQCRLELAKKGTLQKKGGALQTTKTVALTWKGEPFTADENAN